MIRPVGAALAVVALMACGCARTDEGTPVRGAGISSSATPSTTSLPPTSAEPPDTPEPGVLETTRVPIAPGTLVCEQPPAPRTTVATVADPAAPQVVVNVPDGWSTAPGDGDVGARLTGPDGLAAEVSITATPLDAAEAFTKYADAVMGRYPIATLSVLPAELCDYSGQKLMGTWADDPEQTTQYTDRIVHVWTDAGNYLVAVHVHGPSDTPGFDPAVEVLTGDFSIGLR